MFPKQHAQENAQQPEQGSANPSVLSWTASDVHYTHVQWTQVPGTLLQSTMPQKISINSMQLATRN